MYKMSEQINEIMGALSKAQKTIQNASKNAQNPHFRSKYADLSEVLNASREPLSENGLAVVQTVDEIEGRYYLITTLGHASGQFLQSRLPLIMSKNDMQGLGSAISYARRYALSAMIGISQEDDDGEENRKSLEKKVTPLKYPDTKKEASINVNFSIEDLKKTSPENIDLKDFGKDFEALCKQYKYTQPAMIERILKTPDSIDRFWANYLETKATFERVQLPL